MALEVRFSNKTNVYFTLLQAIRGWYGVYMASYSVTATLTLEISID